MWKTETEEPEQHLRSGMLFMFDDGIGGCADGAQKLLDTIVEDDDTPGKLLYYYPPNFAVEKIYFLLGFVIQASRLLADLQGSSTCNSQGLFAAKRRLAYAGVLHKRLGSAYGRFGCRPSVALARRVAETELESDVDDVTARERHAAEERSRLETHPRASITLDHARLSVMYSQGITWVLTTDLGLPDTSLADHLEATVQGFWFVAKGSRKCLLSSCNYARDDYKDAVTGAASLMAPFAMAQLSGDFRCSRPMAYVQGASCTQSAAVLTASQLMDVVQRQQNSIGCVVVAASGGDIRCIASTMDTTTTQWALSISCSCAEKRSIDSVGSPQWAFSCPIAMDTQTCDALLDNFSPLQRLLARQQVKAGLHIKVASHADDLLIVQVMPTSDTSDEGWSQPNLVTEYGIEGSAIFRSLLKCLQKHVQEEATASLASQRQIDELQNETESAARRSVITAGVTCHSSSEMLVNKTLTAAFSPACEAFRQIENDHRHCNQIILGTSKAVTVCRNAFGTWSAFTKTAHQASRVSLSLELIGADFESQAASILGI